jgi:uncharacterized protein YukE
MPKIGDMQYGFDTGGLEQYLDSIKTEALQNAKDAVSNTDGIKSACENNWEGKARENYLANLEKDKEHVNEQLDALYNILESEISSVMAAMRNKDEQLISQD